MDISIVIPVYNVEKYLRRCLNSVCAQADCVKEIILVNDGSTDCSPDICNEYAKKEKRIKIINQENKGLKAAVAVGINAASCEYIGFVDSDDYIEPDMFKELAESIEMTGADMACCQYDVLDENENFLRKKELGMPNGGVYEKVDKKFQLPMKLLPTIKSTDFISASRWNKLASKELLVNSAGFDEKKLRVGEDMALIIPAAMNAKKIVVVNKCLYHYIVRGKSIMRSYNENNLTDWKTVVGILQRAITDMGYVFDNFNDNALAVLLSSCLVPLRNSDIPRSQKKKEYKRIANDPNVVKLLHETKVDASFRRKLLFRLLKYKMCGLLSLLYK